MKKSPFLLLSYEERLAALEAILFASDEALSPKDLFRILIEMDAQEDVADLEHSGAPSDEQIETPEERPAVALNGAGEPTRNGNASDETIIISQLDVREKRRIRKEYYQLFEELTAELNRRLEETNRAFRIVEVAGGYQFATTSQHGELVARLVKGKSKKRLSRAALETLAIVSYRQPISKPEIENIRGVNSNEVMNNLMEKNLVTMVGRSEEIGRPLLYGTTDEFLRAFGLSSLGDLPKVRELDELIRENEDEGNPEKTLVVSSKEEAEEIERKIQSMVDPEQTPPEDPSASLDTE